MKTKILALWALLALSAACSKQEDSEVKIINGRPVPVTSPAYASAVRLDLGGGLCTGSVIAPKLILTASHCLAGVGADNITVTFDRVPSGNPARFGRVARTQTFKSFGADRFPNFDVAYLELVNEVPAPYAPIEILRDASSLSKETPILLAGYGNQVDDCQSENCVGTLRETNTQFQRYYDKAHIMSLLIFHGGATQGLGGACNGDSGGPAYAQVGSKWYLIGVTNGLRGDIVPEADGTCASGWDIYTFAGDYANWLENSNSLTLTKDAATNPEPAVLPQVRQGVQQKTKPTSWSEWVNYANHEDPSWYTVDTVLQNLIAEIAQGTGAFPPNATEMLYEPSKTEAAAATLKTLYLSGDSIGDLSPLRSFVSLQQLYLDGTSVNDLSPLDGKAGLSYLGIRNVPANAKENFFNSLGSSRSAIQVLNVENVPADLVNAIDWSAFARLNQVTFEKTDGVLNLSHIKPISSAKLSLGLGESDVEGVLDGTGVSTSLLQLDSLRSTDSKDLKAMVNWESFGDLTDLDLKGFSRDELPDLTSFAWMKNVGLSSNGISTLSDLSLPLGLETLDVSGNKLAQLDLKVAGVKALRAYDNPLQDNTCPAGKCEVDTYISPKSFNEYCENAVNAQRNGYTHPYYATLSAIQLQNVGNPRLNCRVLEQIVPRTRYLMLSDSDIRDIRPLAFLNQIQYLVMDNNEISDLSPILGMTRLEYLSLANNQVREFSSFKTLPGLQEVNLMGNPLESLTLDGQSLVQVAFGKDAGPRVHKNFELKVSDATNLQSLIFGGVELSETSKEDLHNAYSLRSLQSFDGQPISGNDYSDMISLQLVAPTLDLSEGCAIVNGACVKISENGQTQGLLGPMLGTLEGSRVEAKGSSLNLPGLPSVIQTN